MLKLYPFRPLHREKIEKKRKSLKVKKEKKTWENGASHAIETEMINRTFPSEASHLGWYFLEFDVSFPPERCTVEARFFIKNNDYGGLFQENGLSDKILNNFRAVTFNFLVCKTL